jgi:hypothetical protein
MCSFAKRRKEGREGKKGRGRKKGNSNKKSQLKIHAWK